MSTQPEQKPEEAQAPALPDYLTDADATMKDVNATWRYGKPPDYSNTRKVWAQTKTMNHAAGSLPQLVENLVKNWEVEASFKPVLSDWRTIDPENYKFAINGGPPQTAEHMLKVGTYNAILAPNQYYCPAHSDFSSSHKTFKRMMPTFAWEVLEVYSGPPKVAFRWRHWGVMKNDYVGFNDKGEKVTVKAHGGPIDIQGVTVADVDDKVRLQSVMTWFDPMEMFRQIAPDGIVNKQVVNHKAGQTPEQMLDDTPNGGEVQKPVAPEPAQDSKQVAPNGVHGLDARSLVCPILHTLEKAKQQVEALQASLDSSGIGVPAQTNGDVAPVTNEAPVPNEDAVSVPNGDPAPVPNGHENFDSRNGEGIQPAPVEALETDKAPTAAVKCPFPHPHDAEEKVQPGPGQAVVAPQASAETNETHEEMSKVTDDEKHGVMNVE